MELEKLEEMNAWKDANKTSRRETAEHFGVSRRDYDAAIAKQRYHDNKQGQPESSRMKWSKEKIEGMVAWQKKNGTTNDDTARHFGIGEKKYQGAKTRAGLVTSPHHRWPSAKIQRSQPTKPLQAPVEYIDLPTEPEMIETAQVSKGVFVAVICQDLKSLQEVIKGVSQ